MRSFFLSLSPHSIILTFGVKLKKLPSVDEPEPSRELALQPGGLHVNKAAFTTLRVVTCQIDEIPLS